MNEDPPGTVRRHADLCHRHERGLPAALGIPMHLAGTTIGALNIYDAQPRQWADEEVTAAQLLADMATAYIVMVSQLHSAEQLAGQLQHALD